MTKIKASVIIENISQLLTIDDGKHIGLRSGKEMSEPGIIKNGSLAIAGNRIVAVGKTGKLNSRIARTRNTRVINARGKTVTPGLVDCHSHPVFAGRRANEFEMRIQGKKYLEIAAAGGGINATVKATRKASANKLYENGSKVLNEMMRCGTTTLEGKSGYGLTLKDELKLLKVIKKLSAEHPLDIVPTFLGAHEIPPEFKGKPDKYIGLVCGEMIPEVVKKKLAEFCDVFCEKGVFTPKQTRLIMQTAQAFGLGIKIHADQINSTGGAELAAEFNAISADHLECVTPEGLHLMAKAGVIPVLLPGSTFILKTDKTAPARDMIDKGMPVALGTDLNPGSSPIHSMVITMSLACLELKLTPAEAICAATINSAFAIKRGNSIGSLSPGKKADIVIWDTDDYRDLTYWFGTHPIDSIFKNGVEIKL